MKLITTLFALLFVAIIITGCGPHWNMNAKPDVYDDTQQEEQPKQEKTQ
jgi:hypothetical protein